MTEVRRAKYLHGQCVSVTRAMCCTFVVSVGSHGPDLDAVCAGWDWTQDRFDNCAMLVGDSLQRLTIEATEALPPDQASLEAARRAAELIAQLKAAFPQAAIMRTSEVTREAGFGRWVVRFEDAFDRLAAFRSILEQDARAFCERQRRRGRLASSFDKAFSLAVRYLIEEVAIYALLAEQDWLAETYLGNELNILAAFMRGEFPGLAPPLERRTHVSLRISSLRRAA
jgi:tRNA-dependent cyclodipeptide synthase